MHSVGEHNDEFAITAKVRAGLVAAPVTRGYQISIKTFKGVVPFN